MNTIIKSELFDSWLTALKDTRAKFNILARLRRAEIGNFGDCRPVGDGISEMRIHVGQGYRIYFVQEGDCVYVLIVGGDKSTQQKDISKAKALAKERRLQP